MADWSGIRHDWPGVGPGADMVVNVSFRIPGELRRRAALARVDLPAAAGPVRSVLLVPHRDTMAMIRSYSDGSYTRVAVDCDPQRLWGPVTVPPGQRKIIGPPVPPPLPPPPQGIGGPEIGDPPPVEQTSATISVTITGGDAYAPY